MRQVSVYIETDSESAHKFTAGKLVFKTSPNVSYLFSNKKYRSNLISHFNCNLWVLLQFIENDVMGNMVHSRDLSTLLGIGGGGI